jgi:hypothetical protein
MTYLTSTLGALTLSALSALTFLACNGSGGALTPEEQIARFCDDTTTPACDAFFGCCDGSSALNGYGTVGGCESSLGGSCNAEVTDALLPLITAGSMVLDEARLAACVSKLEGLKAGGAACVAPPLYILTFDCVAAFRGTIAPGQPCDAPKVSVSALAFLPCEDGICQDGKCQAFLATGDACTPEQKDPAVGPLCNFANDEWCIGSGATGHCGPRGKIGEACGVPGESTLECETTLCGAGGKCAAGTAKQLCDSVH